MHQLITDYPLGTVITLGAAGLAVNHIPFLVDRQAGPQGTLRGHVARANPLWRDAGGECIIVFQGPQQYISPNWYPGKHQTGKAVPTWNYAVVHAHGQLRVIDDPAWLRQMVSDLTDQHEQRQAIPWQLSDAPADYTDQMLSMIVGIELSVVQLVGKWKVSQNRPTADRLGVVAGLAATPGGEAMSALVQNALDANKK